MVLFFWELLPRNIKAENIRIKVLRTLAISFFFSKLLINMKLRSIYENLWKWRNFKKKDSSSKSRKILGFHNAELIKYFNLSLEKNCPQIIFSFIIFHEKGRINHKGVNSSLFYPNFLAFLHFKILN